MTRAPDHLGGVTPGLQAVSSQYRIFPHSLVVTDNPFVRPYPGINIGTPGFNDIGNHGGHSLRSLGLRDMDAPP